MLRLLSTLVMIIRDNKRTYTYNNDNQYKSCFSLKQDYENRSYKDLIDQIFKGKEIESFAKNINIRTYNVPNNFEEISQQKIKNRVLLPNKNNNQELRNNRDIKANNNIKMDGKLKIVDRNNPNNYNESKEKQVIENGKDNHLFFL